MLQSILVYGLLFFIMMAGGAYESWKYSVTSPNRIINKNTTPYLLHLGVIIPILAFTFVFGCRYDVGIDFLHCLGNYLLGSERENDPYFRYITELMSSNGIHYSIYFSLWAFIQITLIYYSLRKYKFILPFFAFFLIFGTYFMSMMNVMRQQLAACVFMVAIQYIEEKKLVRYLLCVLVAFLFHRSALLLVTVYPILAWKRDWFKDIKFQLLLYFSAIIISISFGDWLIQIIEEPFKLFTNVTGYDDTYRYSLLENEERFSKTRFGNNTGLGIYINMCLTIPIILLCKKVKSYFHSPYFEIVYTLWFISILAGLLFGNSIILYRPFVYIVNFRMVMYAFFAYYCVKQKKSLYNLIFCVFVLLHLAMFLNIISNGEINKSRFLFFWDIY